MRASTMSEDPKVKQSAGWAPAKEWPELGALEAFVAVAETGSFTRAASAVGSSKVALSRRVSELERVLGERLLVRSTRSLALTEAGREVLGRAPGLLAQARELAAAVGPSAEPRGRLRVVTTQLLNDVLLEPVVLPFVRRHRRVELSMEVVADPVAALRAGYDLALTTGPQPDSELGALLLGRARLGCFASASYLEREGAPEVPGDLARHAVAAVGPDRRVRWSFTRSGKTVTQELSPRLTFTSHDLVRRAVRGGVAIARLPTFYAKAADLVPVLPGWACPPAAAYAVFPNRDRPAPATRAFLAELRERLRR